MLVPSLFWKKYFAAEINRQTEFLVDGFVEGLTMIVGGMTEVVKSGEQVSEEAINSEMLAATNENIYKFILFFGKKLKVKIHLESQETFKTEKGNARNIYMYLKFQKVLSLWVFLR